MNSPPTIQDICASFTHQWDGDLACVDRVSSFVTNCIAHGAPHACDMIHELSMCDLKQAWSHWAQALESATLAINYPAMLDHFSRLPTALDYEELRCSKCRTQDKLLELVRCEAEARSKWGDAIGPLYYREKYGVELTPIEVKSRTLTIKFAPQLGRSRPDISVPLCGIVQIGRSARPGQGIGAYELATGTSVVIAEPHERQISRTQLRIQLLTPNYSMICNQAILNQAIQTQASSESCSEPRAEQLPAGQFRLVSFPFMVKLPGVKLIAS